MAKTIKDVLSFIIGAIMLLLVGRWIFDEGEKFPVEWREQLFYPTKAWHIIMYTMTPILTGFFIRHQFGNSWDVYWLVMLPLDIVSVGYIILLIVAEANFSTPSERPQERKIPDLNKTAVYAQSTQAVDLSKSRFVAFTLCRQNDGGLPVNLTETYWVKGKRFKGSREEFVTMLDDWKAHGIIERENPSRKNSPYVVKDWQKMKFVAGGTPLPRR